MLALDFQVPKKSLFGFQVPKKSLFGYVPTTWGMISIEEYALQLRTLKMFC
jgi:hypothetical protein